MARGTSSSRPKRNAANNGEPFSPSLPATRADPLLQVIEHQNLDEKMYHRLRALILERRILPGERIQVDRLAANLGVSRTPVLNALKRLAQEQVVEWRVRRGVYVKHPAVRELASLFEVREVLEGLVARRAATRIRTEEIDEFAAKFRQLEFSAGRPAFQRYLEIDHRFHLRLLEVAGTQPLVHAMNSVNLMIFTFQIGLARPPAETIPEHLAILKALRSRDPNASEKAMRTHLARSRERLEKKAETEEAQQPPSGSRPKVRMEEPGERL